MMLRHAKADSAFKTPRITAGFWIPLIPPDRLRTFFQDFNRSERVVSKLSVHGFISIAEILVPVFCHDRAGTSNVHQTELYGIQCEGFGHFVHHVFPGPFHLLLPLTATGPSLDDIGSVVVPGGFPVWNLRCIKFVVVLRDLQNRVTTTFDVSTA